MLNKQENPDLEKLFSEWINGGRQIKCPDLLNHRLWGRAQERAF